MIEEVDIQFTDHTRRWDALGQPSSISVPFSSLLYSSHFAIRLTCRDVSVRKCLAGLVPVVWKCWYLFIFNL